ncbi:alpha/beta hydrolase [Phyllobacterium chamaecytisi]|uniref:alpha/beta hydrolase n=1 Tax=Phyllobacterium chamaecytisi TaxID=2876082 RepID=UPI001CCAFEAD|nr:alpha/beta hydrolase [Phyllobacterium sp. KW56]MBZ9605126.1 alpha/beta hydrolase [Phyllobacterium sp. KW56]
MAVRKRLVINFTGYEGLHPDRVRGRYLNSSADFSRLWNAKTKTGPMLAEGLNIASMHIETTGANWQTETEFCQYGSADIFDAYAARNVATRFATGLMAFLDIILSGTFFRYLWTSWRFCIFFLWPFAFACFVTLVTICLGLLPLLGGFNALHLIWTIPLALLFGRLLVRWPGDKVFFSYLLDDWTAASDRIHHRNPRLLQRRREFAEHLVHKLQTSDANEVVIVAHSLGTVPAVEAIADVWRSNPQLLKQKPVSLLAAGSCLLMIAFHPRATSLREDTRVVFEETPVLWAEFQTITDIIHFYKSDPAAALGITPLDQPIIRQVRFKNIHSATRYARAKANFFKMHLLFLKGAQIRNPYDMGMFVQGPFAFRDLVTTYRESGVPLDAAGAFI